MTERVAPPNVGAAISWAVRQLRLHAVAYVALAAVVTVILFAQDVASRPLQDAAQTCVDAQSPGQQAACNAAVGPNLLVTVTLFFIFVVLAWLASIGVRRAAVQATHGTLPTFAQMVTGQYLGRYVLYSLLEAVIIAVGLVLCIIPGIVAYIAFQLGPYFVLDRGVSPVSALRMSARAVSAHPGPAVVLALITVAATLAGGLLFGLPTLIALPFASLVSAHLYRQFIGEPVVQAAD